MSSRLFSVALLLGVLALSVWSLWPGESAELPGMLRFGLYDGKGSLRTEQAVRPLVDYLGLAIRRSVRVSVFDDDVADERIQSCELLLLPAAFRENFPEFELLAHAKGHGRVGQLPRPVLVRTSDESRGGELIRGDAFAWRGDQELARALAERGFTSVLDDYDSGHDPYDHAEALVALAHGAYAAALVRDGDLAAALADGVLESDGMSSEILGSRGPAFVLLAKRSLSDGTRRNLRRAALELDHLRLDDASLRVQAVLSALAGLGIHGFVPVEPFPELRP